MLVIASEGQEIAALEPQMTHFATPEDNIRIRTCKMQYTTFQADVKNKRDEGTRDALSSHYDSEPPNKAQKKK